MPYGNRKRKILDEDKYLADLEYIISRDFFPKLEVTNLKLNYYHALDDQDFITMKEIQMKLNKLNDCFDSNRSHSSHTQQNVNNEPFKNPNIKEDRDLSLDEYLAKNTSEDNDSFRELQKKAIEKQLRKYESSFKAAKAYQELKNEAELKEREQLAIDFDSENLNGDIKNGFDDINIFNPVFFNPDSIELSAEEKINQSHRKSTINYQNCDFKVPISAAKRRSAEKSKNDQYGKFGVDGKPLNPGATPTVNGYTMLGRSPTPGMETPELTWGEIDGTPREISEIPTVSKFFISDISGTERVANELAEKFSLKKRNKKANDMARARHALSSHRTGTGGRSHLTPAALQLLNRMTPSISGYSRKLYHNQQQSRSRVCNTPSVRSVTLTPSPARESAKKKSRSSITDGLLNL